MTFTRSFLSCLQVFTYVMQKLDSYHAALPIEIAKSLPLAGEKRSRSRVWRNTNRTPRRTTKILLRQLYRKVIYRPLIVFCLLLGNPNLSNNIVLADLIDRRSRTFSAQYWHPPKKFDNDMPARQVTLSVPFRTWLTSFLDQCGGENIVYADDTSLAGVNAPQTFVADLRLRQRR